MATFKIVWKIIDGDLHEQEFRGYEQEIDAVDDWMEHHNIDMEEIEYIHVNEVTS